MAITNLKTYALQSEDEIRKKYQNLLLQKYGEGNFDINKPYEQQTGKALSSWTDLDEERAGIEYTRYLNDISQAQTLKNVGQQLQQEQATALSTQGISNDLVQKYLGNTMRASGMANSGVADLQQQGITNQYQKNIENIKNQTKGEANYYIDAYKSMLQEGDYNEYSQKQPIEAKAAQQFAEGVEKLLGEGTLTIEDYKKARDVFARNANVTPDEIRKLDEYYINSINEKQEEKLFNEYGITNKTYTYSLDNELFTNLPRTRQDDINSNQEKLAKIKASPDYYNGSVVKLETATGRQTYLIYNGRLYNVKSKFEEEGTLSGKVSDLIKEFNNPNVL